MKPRVAKKERLAEILRLLEKYYPNAECALHYRNPFELSIAVILSAQCTDERVNTVTPRLFARFPTPQAMAKASLPEIEQIIRPTGFFKNKAKSLKGFSESLVEDHDNQVPQTLEELIKLAGVGRKTANVVMGVAFGIPSGIVVDTHVTRLSNRLGLVKGENAVQIERDLLKQVPQEKWIDFSHWLIHHGRQVCKARTPQCAVCFLNELCPKVGVDTKRRRTSK